MPRPNYIPAAVRRHISHNRITPAVIDLKFPHREICTIPEKKEGGVGEVYMHELITGEVFGGAS